MMIHTNAIRRLIDSIKMNYNNGFQENAPRSANHFKKDLMYGLLELERQQPVPVHDDSGQNDIMKFDPATGEPKPYPSHAGQYRAHYAGIAWLFNPWTGERRFASDVGEDLFGHRIV